MNICATIARFSLPTENSNKNKFDDDDGDIILNFLII